MGSTPTLGTGTQRVGSSVAERLPVKERVVGSNPTLPSSDVRIVLVEQSGVLATLSRWRPRVQIPPGTLVVVS